jgi:hypothetical protein
MKDPEFALFQSLQLKDRAAIRADIGNGRPIATDADLFWRQRIVPTPSWLSKNSDNMFKSRLLRHHRDVSLRSAGRV